MPLPSDIIQICMCDPVYPHIGLLYGVRLLDMRSLISHQRVLLLLLHISLSQAMLSAVYPNNDSDLALGPPNGPYTLYNPLYNQFYNGL